MAPDPRARLRDIVKEKSFRKGDFTLASGKKSNYFFDMKATMLDPEGAELIAGLVLEKIREAGGADAVGGLELGAVPIVSVVVARSAGSTPISGFIVRKQVKDHGTQQPVDGHLPEGSRVILVEDVTTTGQSVGKAIRAARERGCTVEAVVTLVDRLEGAEENLRAEGVRLLPILTRAELE